MYREEHAHLMKRVTFECWHDINRISLVAQFSEVKMEIAVPLARNRAPQFERRILIQNEDKTYFHLGEITGIWPIDSKKQVRKK